MGFALVIFLSAISVYWAAGFADSTTVFQPTTPQTRKTLLRVPASVRIPDCYFVNVRQAVSESEIHQLVEDLRARDANDSMPDFSAQVMFVITKLGYGFSAKLSAEALDYVRTTDIVSYLEEDEVFEAGESNFRSVRSTPRSVPWGLDKLDSDFSDGLYHPPCNLTGRGVDVYVLDSGIEYTNAYFEGRALYPGCDVVDEVEGERRRGADCNGHGTSVATVIGGSHLGVARNVSLFSMRVLSCNKSGSSTNVVKGLECMIEHHSQRGGRPAIVNLSLFGRKSKLLKRAIDKVVGFGVTVVASSGNVGQGTSTTSRVRDACRVSPGSIHGVITVAGSTRDNLAYDVTKMGSCVDILAPGKDIVTASIGLGNFCPYCSTVLSGSSFAAPHVTGAIALLLEKCPNLTPWRVKHILLSRMTKANLLNMNAIHRRYRGTTPNLSLRLDSSICSMEC